MTARIVVLATRVYSAVVSSLAWPRSVWITRISTPCSSRWVAKLCRSVCGDTRLVIPAAWAAARTTRPSWRADSGSTGLRPGNSQPPGSSRLRRRPSRHQAQQFEQLRRQHRVAVLVALAALDAQQHPLGIDIADLERNNLRDAQPGAVRGGERCLVLWRRCRLQQQRHLLDAEYRRYPPWVRHDGEPPCQIWPVERHREEEAQRRDRAVDARRLHAALRLVQPKEAQFFRRRRVRRPADESREGAHVANIIAPRVLLETAHAHVFGHARPQRADGPR